MVSFPSAETRPLLLWHEAGREGVDIEPIRKAKEALGLPFKVVPEWVGLDFPPSGRVLALDSRPPWVCDYALLTGRGGVAGLEAALAWVLGDHSHPRATTVADIISATFPGAREMSVDELASEKAMSDFLNRMEETEAPAEVVRSGPPVAMPWPDPKAQYVEEIPEPLPTTLGPNGENWRELIDAVKAKYAPVVLADDEEEPEKFWVTVPNHQPDIAEIPAAMKRMVQRVGKNRGWRGIIQHSRTHHAELLYAADSKKKPGQESPDHRKGDVRVPPRDMDHWGLQAVLSMQGMKVARFWATWATIDGKNTFEGVTCWDMVSEAKVLFTQVKQFEEWLRVLAPEGAPAVKEIAPVDELTPLRAELEKGEWQG